MISEQNKEVLTKLISTIVKGCDTYQAALSVGQLDIIVNNGIMYHIDIRDMFPSDAVVGINYRNKIGYTFYDDIAFNMEVYNRMNYDRYDPSSNLLYRDTEFGEDPLFSVMRNSRSDEGQFKFIFDSDMCGKIILILYKGIFNLNKKDTITISIYDNITRNAMSGSNPATYVYVIFTVHKESLKRDYTICFTALNLWRGYTNGGNA